MKVYMLPFNKPPPANIKHISKRNAQETKEKRGERKRKQTEAVVNETPLSAFATMEIPSSFFRSLSLTPVGILSRQRAELRCSSQLTSTGYHRQSFLLAHSRSVEIWIYRIDQLRSSVVDWLTTPRAASKALRVSDRERVRKKESKRLKYLPWLDLHCQSSESTFLRLVNNCSRTGLLGEIVD